MMQFKGDWTALAQADFRRALHKHLSNNCRSDFLTIVTYWRNIDAFATDLRPFPGSRFEQAAETRTDGLINGTRAKSKLAIQATGSDQQRAAIPGVMLQLWAILLHYGKGACQH